MLPFTIVTLVAAAFISIWLVWRARHQDDTDGPSGTWHRDVILRHQQEFAFDTLKFGASEAQFLRAFPNPEIRIDSYQYFAEGSFDSSGGLFRITLKSQPQSVEVYHTDVTKRKDVLKRFFTNQYGMPEDMALSAADLWYQRPDEIQFQYFWTVGRKNISVGIGQVMDSNYYAMAMIDCKEGKSIRYQPNTIE